MTYLRSLGLKLTMFTLAALLWTAIHGTALARGGAPKQEDDGGGGASAWTMPYFLVILAIGMGMLAVCRSSRRRDRARPESYEGGKPIDETEE